MRLNLELPISFLVSFYCSKENNCFNKDFLDKGAYKKTYKYHHYLNF